MKFLLIRCITALCLLSGTAALAQAPHDNELAPGLFEVQLQSAQRGHAGSQVLVGLAYQVNYLGVEQNFKEAVRWFRLAANQGHQLGQNLLAKSYFYGMGVTQDFAQAKARFKTAAEQGEPEAQFMLASIYLDLGDYDELERNPKEAYRWFSRSAQQNYIPAYAALASLYENGFGVEKDLEVARNWYKKSCDQGIYASCEPFKHIDDELNELAEKELSVEDQNTTEVIDF